MDELEKINNTEDTDLVFTAKLMKKYVNQQSMIRDLYCYAINRKKGIKAEMLQTGNAYIDEVAKFIDNLTK